MKDPPSAMSASLAKCRILRHPAPTPMELERRLMFDAAIGADSSIKLVDAAPSNGHSLAFSIPNEMGPAVCNSLMAAQPRVLDQIRALLDRSDWRDALAAVFNPSGSRPSWNASVDALRQWFLSGGAEIRLEVRAGAEMPGIEGAFSATGTRDEATIYLNGDWLALRASDKALDLVLIEELGHAFDARLGGPDTVGDEGRAFAALVVYGNTNLAVDRSVDDHTQLVLDGHIVPVETAAPYLIAQTHYVPMTESNIQSSLKSISSSVTGNIQTVIAISATGNHTLVVYDQWEDGYEADIANPLQSTTKVWTFDNGQWFVDANGNGVQDKGESAPAGTGVTASGNTLILSNAVNPSSPATIDFDGRDKIGSTQAVSVTRAAWSITPGTVLAGIVNVVDAGNAGASYTLPVGENVETVATGSNRLFESTTAHVMATQDGTTVSIDKDGDGKTDFTVRLNEGQAYLVNGGLMSGARISADKAIGVYLIAGDVGSSYESRWFALSPDTQWSNSYFAPVSTTLATDPTYVILFNPNSTPISVRWDSAAGAQSPITVGARSTSYVLIPASAAHFYTVGAAGAAGPTFYAVAAIDADAVDNQTHDWSYSLVPESYLTDKFVVGWAPGYDKTVGASSSLNGSPVWMTPTEDTTVYVKSSTITVKDSQGNAVATVRDAVTGDYVFSASKLQSYRLFDNADKDQTGLTVYTLDGTLITAAWGEDPSIAGPGNPYLDMGTTVSPYPDYVLTKTSAETSPAFVPGASDGDLLIEPGEQITYTVRLINRSVIDLYDIVLKDTATPADSVDYVADSTRLTVYDQSGTLAWTIEGGRQTVYNADGSVQSTTANTSLGGTGFPLAGSGYRIVDLNPNTAALDGLKRGGVIEVSYRVQIRDSVTKTFADSNYVISNVVTLQSPGVVKEKTNLTNVSVNVTDGVLSLMDASFADSASNYAAGSIAGLQVIDGDQNKNPLIADTVTVMVTNLASGEIEERILTETGPDTGIFRGTLATSASAGSASNDGLLHVAPGESIQVDYVDAKTGGAGAADSNGIDNPVNWGISPSTYTTGTNSNRKIATIGSALSPSATPGRLELLDSAFSIPQATSTAGTSIGIRVTDPDQNRSSSRLDTLSVRVTDSSSGEIDLLILTETGIDTGIFQATLATTTDPQGVSGGNHLLHVGTGDVVTIDYTDPDDPGDHVAASLVVIDNVHNAAPVARPNHYETSSDATVSGNFLLDVNTTNAPTDDDLPDSDADPGDTAALRITEINTSAVSTNGTTVFQLPSGAVLSVNSAGSASYDPAGVFDDLYVGETATDTFTYAISDGHGGTNSAQVSVIVAGTAQPPRLSFDNPSVNESAGVLEFTVTKRGLATRPVSIIYAIDAGPTTSPVGAYPIQGELTFEPEENVKTIQVPITNDMTYEGTRSVTLYVVSVSNATVASNTAIGKVSDDGTGDGGTDDDRALLVSSPEVNEASPYAVFSVGGAAGQRVTLTLVSGATHPATGDGVDYGSSATGSDLEVSIDGGMLWSTYTAGAPFALNAAGTALVRTAVINDTILDPGETFDLRATNTGGSSATGTATIRDDGTGTVFTARGDVDANTLPDDDRPLKVSSPEVNEASPYAVFSVGGAPGQRVTLTLVSGATQPATGDGVDYGSSATGSDLEVSIDGGMLWSTYTAGAPFALNAAGTALVRTAVINDTILDPGETFGLRATNSGGGSATGTATIRDDGTGTVFTARGDVDANTLPDDDRPKRTVAAPTTLPPLTYLAVEPARTPMQELPGQITGTMPSLIAQDGAKVVVLELPPILLARRVPDQFADPDRLNRFAVPEGLFVHTNAGERLTFSAELADGQPVPPWLMFNGITGTFEGKPPAQLKTDLEIKVTARDTLGNEVGAVFRLNIKGSAANKDQSTELKPGVAPAPTSRGSLKDSLDTDSEDAQPDAVKNSSEHGSENSNDGNLIKDGRSSLDEQLLRLSKRATNTSISAWRGSVRYGSAFDRADNPRRHSFPVITGSN